MAFDNICSLLLYYHPIENFSGLWTQGRLDLVV